MDHKQDSGSKWQMNMKYDRFTLENSCSKDDVIPYSASNFCVEFLNDLASYMHGNRFLGLTQQRTLVHMFQS